MEDKKDIFDFALGLHIRPGYLRVVDKELLRIATPLPRKPELLQAFRNQLSNAIYAKDNASPTNASELQFKVIECSLL